MTLKKGGKFLGMFANQFEGKILTYFKSEVLAIYDFASNKVHGKL